MRLKELRLGKGLTQRAVASIINCSESAYAKYEREKIEPDIATLKTLSKYYNVTIDYIVGND